MPQTQSIFDKIDSCQTDLELQQVRSEVKDYVEALIELFRAGKLNPEHGMELVIMAYQLVDTAAERISKAKLN